MNNNNFEIYVRANVHVAQDTKVFVEVDTKPIWRNVVTLRFSNGDYCDINIKSFYQTARYLTTYENVQAVDAFIEGLKEGNNNIYEQLASKYGIKVGNRYRINHLCSDNDREILDVDFKTGEVKMKQYIYGHNDGFMEEFFTNSLLFVMQQLDQNQCYSWIQIDQNRHDIKQKLNSN